MPAAESNWDLVKKSIPLGTQVTGAVVERRQFGVFIDIGVGINALLLVTRFAPSEFPVRATNFEGYPSVGDRVTARVLILGDDRHTIALTQLSADE
jgi:ribosomal protein S1